MRHEPPDVTPPLLKPLEWIASSRKDLKALPESDIELIELRLRAAQQHHAENYDQAGKEQKDTK